MTSSAPAARAWAALTSLLTVVIPRTVRLRDLDRTTCYCSGATSNEHGSPGHVDDLALAGRGRRLVVFLAGHGTGPTGSSLTPRATIRSAPSGSGRCSFRASSEGAVIQVSTSAGVVRITGIAFGWMAPTSAFGSVVRNAKMSLVVSPSFTFRTDVQLVQMPAKQARGRVSSSANQISPPSALLNSLKLLNGTTQRFSTPSHLVQCLLFTLRMLVVPPSGSIRSSCLKSTGLPFA